MRKVLVAALLAVFALASTAQAETLKLLTWKGYAPQKLIEAFEKETGIKVEVTFSNNEEMIAKLRATRGAGFDLAQPSQDRISSVQEKFHLYQALDYSKIDAGLFIPSMLAAVKKNTLVGGESFAVPFCWGTSGLIVNADKAADADSFKALIDPKYKGRVSYRLKRPTLIAMVKNYWANGDSLLESMRSSEVFVAMAWDAGGWKLHADNAAIDFKAPAEGALGWIATFAIPAKAENVAAAYKWINFMMKPENCGFFSSQEKYATASKDALKFTDEAVAANFARSFPQDVIDNIAS